MDKITNHTIINNHGQAITEYVLLLAIILTIFTNIMNVIMETDAIGALKKPLETDFKYTYQYGHPKVRGQENGGPKNVPLKFEPNDQHQNFRIFINPPIN